MKYKLTGSLIACVLFQTMLSQGAIWGGAGATDNWSDSANWLSGNIADGSGENAEFRTAGANVVLTQERTVLHLYQQNTAANHYFSGSALTMYGNLSNFSVNSTEMIFNNAVTMNSVNDHIQTAGLGSLELAGGLSITTGAVELAPNGGGIIISGSLDAGGREIRLQDGTAGTVALTGSGAWTGGGTLRIYDGTFLAARTASDSTGIAADTIQLFNGGTLRLGNAEQIVNTENIGFVENGGVFDLDGYAETIKGFATAAAVSGNVAMGTAGVLHLANQSSADILAGLLITEWADGEDHIYVDGGSFSVGQLSAITFDGYGAGAQVLGGELIPVAIPEPATLGLLALFGFALFVRRHLSY